jgi:hypothetical protein
MGTPWEHDENMVGTDPKNPPLPQKNPKERKYPRPLSHCLHEISVCRTVKTILNLN